MITQDQLKEVLDYNRETGVFTWIESPAKNVAAGSEAGSFDGGGYIQIVINNKNYKAHRLAILYTEGYLPELTVDHIDRVRWHNWRSNLCEASRQCQMRNRGMNKNNTSGVNGVYWNKPAGKWYAQVAINSKLKNLGYFDTILEAAYHRYAAEQCLGFQDCDLNSSARKYIDQHKGKI